MTVFSDSLHSWLDALGLRGDGAHLLWKEPGAPVFAAPQGDDAAASDAETAQAPLAMGALRSEAADPAAAFSAWAAAFWAEASEAMAAADDAGWLDGALEQPSLFQNDPFWFTLPAPEGARPAASFSTQDIGGVVPASGDSETTTLVFDRDLRRLEEYIDGVRIGPSGAAASDYTDVALGAAYGDSGFDALNYFVFTAIDSADDVPFVDHVAHTHLYGVAVQDAGDEGLAIRSIEGDETLSVAFTGLGDAYATDAQISIMRLVSDPTGDGAEFAHEPHIEKGGSVTLEAYRSGSRVASETYSFTERYPVIDYDPGAPFDEIRLSAGDAQSYFRLGRLEVTMTGGGAAQSQSSGYQASDFTGAGQMVVVIDTGWSETYQGADETPIYDYDFRSTLAGGEDGDARSANDHGARVTQVLYQEAPGIDTIHLKIFPEDGSAYVSDAEAALQWVIDHADQYDVAAVNLSFGGGSYTEATGSALSDELEALKSLGVITVAAAGNDGELSVTTPAADANVLAVSFTDQNGDAISSAAQHHPDMTDIFAIGEWVKIGAEDGSSGYSSGSSFAAPAVTAAAARVQEAADAVLGRSLSQDEFVDLIQTTGDPINGSDAYGDPAGYVSLDADAAVQYLIDNTGEFLFA